MKDVTDLLQDEQDLRQDPDRMKRAILFNDQDLDYLIRAVSFAYSAGLYPEDNAEAKDE